MSEVEVKEVAELTVADAASLTPGELNQLASWLREKATLIQTTADELAPQYRATFSLPTK